MFTTASNKSRTSFRANHWLHGFILMFLSVWIITFVRTTDLNNWMLENLLVVIYLCVFIPTYRKYQFSDLSYLFFLVFLVLHVYGSQNTYAENPLGFWLKDLLNWERNHYDRIVHFSAGLLLAYPWRELLIYHLKFPSRSAWAIPVVMSFVLSGSYELIEWAVAAIFFPEQGPNYLGTQGDVWDAQKDSGLAVLGALIATTLLSVLHRFYRSK